MTSSAVVAVLRTQPETVLQDYHRLFDLAGGSEALDPQATTILKDNILLSPSSITIMSTGRRRKHISTRTGGPTLPGGNCSSGINRKGIWKTVGSENEQLKPPFKTRVANPWLCCVARVHPESQEMNRAIVVGGKVAAEMKNAR